MPPEPDATRVVTVFESAVDLPPEERARFLDRECAGDAALRAEVESLLAHLREAPSSGSGEASRRGSREDARPHVPAQAPPMPCGTLLGRYVVLERLGAGGMGVVHRAYDTVLDRAVALKLLPSHGGWRSGPARTRLLQEAQAMARLTHPHVVGVFDAGEVDGQVFIAMELVEGTTLRDWLQASARGWREVVEVFTAAGRGLAAAHAVGLVHRDFKPSNVLVGRDGRVRVTDFGLAHAAPGEPLPGTAPGLMDRAPPGLAVGTLAYMAPEQFAGGAVDARADLFSFCVAFWEALHGELPFPGESAAERLTHAREGRLRPPPPSTRVPPGGRSTPTAVTSTARPRTTSTRTSPAAAATTERPAFFGEGGRHAAQNSWAPSETGLVRAVPQ
jgi:serine/threonine protein kinase